MEAVVCELGIMPWNFNGETAKIHEGPQAK